MNLLLYVLAGSVWQTAMLAAFILVSRTAMAPLAKPSVLAVAAAGVAVLLIHASRLCTPGQLMLLCTGLAGGYSAGFHLLGLSLFPGLLKDFDPLSLASLLDVLCVTATVFGLYALAALGALVGLAWWRRGGRKPGQRDMPPRA